MSVYGELNWSEVMPSKYQHALDRRLRASPGIPGIILDIIGKQ